jgi:hypothetical protein
MGETMRKADWHATVRRTAGTSSFPRASAKTRLLPGSAYCPPWTLSQCPSSPHFGVSQESSTLWALSLLEASFSTTALLLLFVQLPICNAQNVEPIKFFRDYVGLQENQITAIRKGKAVAEIVESSTPDEVFVFGSVHVESTPEKYLKLASDLEELRKLPNYLAIREFSNPPQLSDLEGFTLDAEDIKQLKNCEPSRCEVQLPTEATDAFKKSIDWSALDAANQVNRLGQRMALEALHRYIQGGNVALGTYRDKHHPAVVADTFQSLLSRSKALPVYLPELDRYLLDYPEAASKNIQSEFYWEKVNFRLKPTLRIVQAIVYRGPRATDPAYAIAVRQLYASHYSRPLLILPSACGMRPIQSVPASI